MTSMSGDVPLTDLCAICHVEAIKYTCPRCGIHTCSLPCVKRHKQWAQCSGVRDPAVYRKRADLATPASIDQDFNFITKLERSLQRADVQAQEKGLHLTPTNLKSRGHGGKSKFDHEVENRGIKLIRAPQGLTRSKENKSHWAGQKGLMWTVEWVQQGGDRKISNASEKRLVTDAYFAISGKKTPTRKRKREAGGADPTPSAPAEGTQKLMEHGHESGSSEQDPTTKSTADESQDKLGVREEQGREQTESKPICDQPKSSLVEGPHLYLHRPLTSSKSKIVMPIPSNATLEDILKDRTILEHPTIFALEQMPEELQEPFILEGIYLQGQGENPFEQENNLPLLPNPQEVNHISENVDVKHVLEVLKQDLND